MTTIRNPQIFSPANINEPSVLHCNCSQEHPFPTQASFVGTNNENKENSKYCKSLPTDAGQGQSGHLKKKIIRNRTMQRTKLTRRSQHER